MTTAIHGPGLLHVRSRIANAILDERTFLQWYDDEHIAEVVQTPGIRSGFRYIDIRKTSPCGDTANPKPFLAFYPMDDLAFTLGDEIRKIGFQSKNLPGSGVVYDLADLDVSYLGLVGKTAKTIELRGPPKYIVTCGLRQTSSAESSKEYADQLIESQTASVSKLLGYIRTLTFQLQYARTNAQSRKLKGLPFREEPGPEPSTVLALHEFSDLPDECSVNELARIGGKIDGISEVYVWKFDRAHGDGTCFG